MVGPISVCLETQIAACRFLVLYGIFEGVRYGYVGLMGPRTLLQPHLGDAYMSLAY